MDARKLQKISQIPAEPIQEQMNAFIRLTKSKMGSFAQELMTDMRQGLPFACSEKHIKSCQKIIAYSPLGSLLLFTSTLEAPLADYTKLFLEAGFDINTNISIKLANEPSIIIQSPLMRAICFGNTAVAELLLEYQPNIDLMFEESVSALTLAAYRGNLKIIEAIFKKHPLCISENKGCPPLLAVIEATDIIPQDTALAIASFLLENGASVDAEFKSPKLPTAHRPISFAIDKKNESMVALLIKYGVKVDNHITREAIKTIIRTGQFGIFEKIFTHCPSMQFDIASDQHPYYYLPDNPDEKKKWLALFFTHKIITVSNLPFLNLRMKMIQAMKLFDLSSFLAELVENKKTLSYLSEELRYKFCQDLIAHNREKKIKQGDELLSFLLTLNGTTSLPEPPPMVGAHSLINYAIEANNMPALDLLLQHNAPAGNIDHSYETTDYELFGLFPIHIAILKSPENEISNIISKLIEHGANINAVCSPDGRSALFYAGTKRNLTAVEYLLRNGADIHLKDQSGKSLIKQAILYDFPYAIIRAIVSEPTLDVAHYTNEIKLALYHNRIDVVGLFIWRHFKNSPIPKQTPKLNEEYSNIIHLLINMGMTIHELTPLLEGYFSPATSKKLPRNSFVENLYTCLLKDASRLPASSITALQLLSSINSVLASEESDKYKKLSGLLTTIDLKSISDQPETPYLSEIITFLIRHYIDCINQRYNQILAEKKQTSLLQENLTSAIILMNKQTSLLTYLSNTFSIKPEELPPFPIDATLYLIHEKRISVKKALSAERQKISEEDPEKSKQNWLSLEKERLISLEAEKIKEKKIADRRKKQSDSDRKKYEESMGHVLISAKKRTRYRSYLQSPFKPVKTVSLSAPLLQAFSLLDVVQGEKYIVGSAIIELLYPERKKGEETDIDMTAAASSTQITSAGFFKNRHMDNLYNYKISAIKVDLLTAPIQDKSWRRDDHRKRDFTICTLSCDQQGNIYDPTGRGLSDLENWILSTGKKDSYQCLSKDPVRILRAIKYILRGYRPDERLIAALQSEYTNLEKHKDHLYAYARHYLRNDNARGFIQQLSHYKLLSQLFNVKSCSSIDEMAKDLWKELEEKPVAAPSYS